jgi:hypothetical protein
MAKTTAPLLSFGAGGQIGKTQVYASWRGVPYARRYVIPANPNTLSQQATRGVFSWLNGTWKLMAAPVQAVWTAFAKGKPLTDRNAWIKSNLADLRGTDTTPVTTISALIASPGVNGGYAAAGMVLTDGTGHVIDVALTAPSIPAGWSITAQHAIAFKQQDANTDQFYSSYYGTDVSSPYAATISTGAAGTYVVASFFEFKKPDNSVAYGPSSVGSVTLA